MTLLDAAARHEALDITQSVCVSAPAGSGKTALLVQRTLALLACVGSPENVVAVTFTRKAAAEMRVRLLSWLRRASEAESTEDPFEAELLRLATRVLRQDRAQGWGLLESPSRLRIQTIDSFCGELTRQMPILSGCGGPLATVDRAEPLYREAIESFLKRELGADDARRRDDVQRLMLHLDNQWETAVELLTGLLRRREQWQPVFGGSGLRADDRGGLRLATETLVDFYLQQLRDQLTSLLPEIAELMNYRCEQLPDETAFDPDSNEIAGWRSMSRFLLTQSGSLRRTLTKREGFPADKGVPAQQKERALALLETLGGSDYRDVIPALQRLSVLPDTRDDDAHWDVLASLTRLLPRLGAELLLVFQARGEVDHAQIAMAALAALGDDEAPTDVALRLDHSIEHLLVDEFQDTSSLQFELIRRLTRGWYEHNQHHPEQPRTLLLVGDAMQSIYGFREANVGLFLKARNEGVGDLPLTPVELTVNFRSQQGLVDWVNQQFVAAFPSVDDAQLGAVQFSPADAAREGGAAPRVSLFTGPDAASAEVDALCTAVAASVDDDKVSSVAILGRSRQQLRPVLAALRDQGIQAAARDLDALMQRPLIRDLVSLCSVLFDRFDRFAWLSLLRCPAIALTHADLLIVALEGPMAGDFAQHSERAQACLRKLSTAGRERLEHLCAVLQWAERYRDRLALRVWVEEIWLRLGGAADLRSLADHQDGEQFFQCLEDMELAQIPRTRRSLEDVVEQLYASPGDERCKLQVMTLHKAKGLEFDRVFIPALHGVTRGADQELLLWEELALPGEAPRFLLDVRASADDDGSSRLYDYLKSQAKQRRQLEATRLFYVGCTRAADSLWLSGCVSWDDKKDAPRPPASGSLLAAVWSGLGEQINVHCNPDESMAPADSAMSYRRLHDLPGVEAPYRQTPVASVEQLVHANFLPRILGTALHRCLESLVYRDTIPDVCDSQLEALLMATLRELGAPSTAQSQLAEEGRASINRVLADSWAQWMLSPKRRERHAELAITVADGSTSDQLVLDYVFVDESTGERWVVDYKSATPAVHETMDGFTARQLDTYGQQLTEYARALRLRYREPIRCALYFTALGRYCEFTPPT